MTVHLLSAQTTPWLLPASISLVWIGIWWGVMFGGLVEMRGITLAQAERNPACVEPERWKEPSTTECDRDR